MVKRVLRVLISYVLAVLFFLPSIPSGATYTGSTTFWDQFLISLVQGTSSLPVIGDAVQGIAGALGGGVCSISSDGLHHTDDISGSSVYADATGSYTFGTCSFCGDRFKVYSSDLTAVYEAQVEELPATGVTSSGSFILDTFYLFCDSVGSGAAYGSFSSKFNNVTTMLLPSDSLPFDATGEYDNLTSYRLDLEQRAIIATCSTQYFTPSFSFNFATPVSGSYKLISSSKFSSDILLTDETRVVKSGSFSADSSFTHRNAGDSASAINFNYAYDLGLSTRVGIEPFCSYGTCVLYFPLYEVIPDSSIGFDNYYTANSRPASIIGDYGIIGDNGQITKVDSNTIVNETNNTIYNPVTNTTSTITDWTYDYSDRSYNVTTESGDTITVTYGDENITIQEGDTVYNVYYIIEDLPEEPGTGGGSGSETCEHEYTSVTDRDPTCTFAGQVTCTCSLCGHTYTESIPALGHSWDIKETVQTSYDEDGNLLQQGYTIYKCSLCGEEYKDESGTGPPSSPGSGGDSGSDGGGESIWDKLGNLIGTVIGGIISMIEAVIGKILDALIALVEMINGKLGQVVTLVLGFFDHIPGLFAGFLSFLSAVFPFLPEDIMLLLTFGIAVVVFIGIIKALRR